MFSLSTLTIKLFLQGHFLVLIGAIEFITVNTLRLKPFTRSSTESESKDDCGL